MRRFGEILLDEGMISDNQLHEALSIQKHASLKVGEVMLQQGSIKPHHIEDVLIHQRDIAPALRFGEIAIHLNLVDANKVAEAIRYQQTSKGMLGDILVELGYITEKQRIDIMAMQARDFQ